jgi:NhaP-type Na+/H+ or K+/H+ antiporter
MSTLVIATFAGMAMQVLAAKVKLPSIVFLMIIGVLLGPQFLNLIQPTVLGDGFEVLVSLAVALILFEGGLSLDFKSFKKVDKSVRNMLTIGLGITVLGSAILCHLILGLEWALSLLFGAFMSITGLTVINPILSRVKVKRDLATILRSEGILSNAFGAFISVAVLEYVLVEQEMKLNPDMAQEVNAWQVFLIAFLTKLFIGLVVGYVSGFLLGKLASKKFIPTDLKNLVVLAWVFATYALSNNFEPNTGILAVVITGFAVQQENVPQLNTLKRFKGQLSILFISILFVLIAADLDFEKLSGLGVPGIIVILGVVFLVRPLAVFLSNIGLLKISEKLFLSWIGPKGIVSASVASLFTIVMREQGVTDAYIVESLVFATIIFTVLLQGLTARQAASITKSLINNSYIIVVGGNVLGRIIGKVFTDMGKKVCIIDNNQIYCNRSSSDKLITVCGNCLDTNVLDQAEISKATLLIATTSNSEVNFLVCQLAREMYQVPYVYPAIGTPDKSISSHLVKEISGDLAYTKVVNIAEWKDIIDQQNVHIFERHLDSSGVLSEYRIPEYADSDWLPIILKRKDNFFFAHSAQPYDRGDILICLAKQNAPNLLNGDDKLDINQPLN